MPHFGNDLAVHSMGGETNGGTVASSPDTRGADLLLSLAERASEHVKSLDTPSGKEFYPLSKAVTPGQGELDQNGRGPMLMSIHSKANHRILPSPIKLQGYSLVYSSSSSESSSPPTLEKREADSPPADEERPLKQSRTEDEAHNEKVAPRHRGEEDANERDNESTNSALISPSSSNEGKKAEVKSPRPQTSAPPHSYYMHHSAPPPHVQQHYAYPHPQYHPSWGHPHAPPPPPHMAGGYYYPPHQYYPMMPPTPASYPPPHMSPHPHHPHSSTPKKPTSAQSSYLSKDAGNGKETPMSSKHAEAQAEAIKSISDWQKGINGAPRTYARCVPLQHPIPSRYWGETNKDVDRKLPDFPRLVNFPDYLSRGQTRSGGDGGSTTEGKRHCVMCGQLRICSKSANKANQKSASPAKSADTDSTVHIIPRQNKGVCTACDVAVWVMVSQDGLEIKWCKGCKNFRPWAAFGEKGLATKCVRCRCRQREKYASQKNEMRRQQESYLEKKEDDILAAQGLSNLMSAQTQNS